MPTATHENSKRIAKNTLMLYFRMFLSMAISLYTSRVVLATLGVDNYGIYNVVGGVVALFSSISGTLSGAITRFITYALGRGDKDKLKTIFCTSVNIQLLMALVVFVLMESVGVWFLNYKMNIPEGRIYAANWVLQCSILTFMINLVSVPYNATIIAHEKMSAFAYISVLEVSLKLAVVFLIMYSPYDKLIVYAILLMLVALLIRMVYGIYCRRHFEEAKYKMVWDKSIFKEMLSFSGWAFIGNSAFILNTQGVNILINLYFGVALNAVRGLAVHVDSALRGLSLNFTMALNPQITKQYASGNLEYMFKLINQGTKFSVFIMCFYFIPLELETETVLEIWLKNVPEYTVIFMRLVLLSSLVVIIGNELSFAILATGRIKKYEIAITCVSSLTFFLTLIVYELGAPASATYIIYCTVYMLIISVRLIFLKSLINFPIRSFIKDTMIPIVVVMAVSFSLPTIIVHLMPSSILRFIVVTIVAIIVHAVSSYIFGLTKSERVFVLGYINKLVKKFRNEG